jgi:rhodanese-related sulfurtransferase
MTVQTLPATDVFKLRSTATPPPDFIDVRTPAEYAQLHAQGARLVPLDQLDPVAVRSARGGNAGEAVYVICRSGARAARAVERFRAAGFDNVVSVDGGTEAWERAGLPVVRGPASGGMSIERQVRVVTGAIVTLGVALGWLVHPAYHALAAFIGVGLVVTGLVDWCGTALLLARMPWNRRAGRGGGGGGQCAT